MKSTSVITTLSRFLILLIIIPIFHPSAELSVNPYLQKAVNTKLVNLTSSQKLSASTSSCQWSYYPSNGTNLQAEQLLFNDPDGTPIINLSLGNMFKGKSAHLAGSGSTDFDGDNKTDVFRTVLRNDGNLQWQYSSGGMAAWQNLAYAGPELPTSVLQFGDFSSDNSTDVFANVYNSGTTNYDWVDSPNGTNSFVTLNTTPFPKDRLALGDFNGDGKTDVFTATASSGTYQWAYSSGGNGGLVNLAFAATDPSLLRFGDFNGDGITDVFAAIQQPDGSTQWVYSSGGATSYINLALTTVPYSELKFGDFNGDGKTDVLVAESQSDGSQQVIYWSGGLAPAIVLGSIPAPAPALRVGDFNGDGISDLMAIRCGMSGPLQFSPLQTLAQSDYSTYYNKLTGDVNGDGRADLILASTCQPLNQSGSCITHHLQVGAALGTFAHTYKLIAPNQLGSNSLDFTYYKILSGDFNGDKKTDLAVIYPNGNTLTIYTALSNGDGIFTLSSPQIFGGETWGTFSPSVGDFNGDGIADLAFTTVCEISSGSCSVGDNNSVYVASSNSTGVFTMSARQDLGPAGWTEYYAYVGDFNGDGKSDLVFNSTCQKTNFVDPTCTISDANYVYTALSNGVGGFTLSSLQTYGASGWADYPQSIDLIGDVNGDGRSDVVWISSHQAAAKTNNNLVVTGLANPNGTFQQGSVQNFGSAWTGSLSLAELNHDDKADLIWNNVPLGNTDMDTYAVATSNGDGTFNNMGQGSVYTGQGFFQIPSTFEASKIPTSLTLVSNHQNSISSALFAVTGSLPVNIVFAQIFADVPTSYWAAHFIQAIYEAGITGGCSTSPLIYCPMAEVTRAQMAVFLLKGIYGPGFTPPAVGASTGFNDVSTSYWAAAWIKQLAAEGITGGCGSGNYCPDDAVTRDQMAVFLLRAEHGSAYIPPTVSASTNFNDVPVSYWAAAWIKQLATEGVTSGCGGGSYCPTNVVTRDQMAVFLQKTFNLPLPVP